MARRLASLAIGLSVVGAACAGADEIHADRIDVLADTCVSIVERRVGGDFDRERLEAAAGAGAIAAIYDRFDDRRPAAVAVLRRQCRVPSPEP